MPTEIRDGKAAPSEFGRGRISRLLDDESADARAMVSDCEATVRLAGMLELEGSGIIRLFSR